MLNHLRTYTSYSKADSAYTTSLGNFITNACNTRDANNCDAGYVESIFINGDRIAESEMSTIFNDFMSNAKKNITVYVLDEGSKVKATFKYNKDVYQFKLLI